MGELVVQLFLGVVAVDKAASILVVHLVLRQEAVAEVAVIMVQVGLVLTGK
jgi:hypothetical protein